MVFAAEAERRDAAEKHLHPCCYRQCLSQYAVRCHEPWTYSTKDTAFNVQAKVDSQDNLDEQSDPEARSELRVDVLGELATFVMVAQVVADNGEDSSQNLYWDVPSRADYLVGRIRIAAWQCGFPDTQARTPRTIPVGNIKPHAAI